MLLQPTRMSWISAGQADLCRWATSKMPHAKSVWACSGQDLVVQAGSPPAGLVSLALGAVPGLDHALQHRL